MISISLDNIDDTNKGVNPKVQYISHRVYKGTNNKDNIPVQIR